MILPLFNGIFVTFQAHGLIEFWDNRIYRSSVLALGQKGSIGTQVQ